MGLLIAVIWALVYVVCFAIGIYLIIWVFETVTDKPVPAKVVQLLWVLLALVAVALIITALAGNLPTFRFGWPALGGARFAALSAGAAANL
jgi:ABC-type bacteriocin/lantibiotic exporter with double-glycine peptidase domain